MNPMLANEYEKHSAKARARVSLEHIAAHFIIQPKLDGVWAAVLPDGRVLSRTGKPLLSMPNDQVDAVRNKHLVIIGELLKLDAPFAESSGLARRTRPQQGLTFVAHDSVCADMWASGDDDETPYHVRLAELSAEGLQTVDALGPFSVAELEATALQYAQRDGYDGLIAKDPEAYYVRRRSINLELVKIKPLQSDSFRVLAAVATQQATKLGGYIVVQTPNGTSRVGTGFTAAMLEEFSARPSHFAGAVAEVQHMGITPAGALREPRFLGFRWDA